MSFTVSPHGGSTGKCDSETIAAPWDAAFVHHVGYWSHYDPVVKMSNWPLPATRCVEELAQFGDTSGTFREAPVSGDVFLLWTPEIRAFTRTGIITHVPDIRYFSRGEKCYKCVTIEGDVDADSSAEGTKTLRRVRNLAPELGDRFIRWTSLDGREERRELIELTRTLPRTSGATLFNPFVGSRAEAPSNATRPF